MIPESLKIALSRFGHYWFKQLLGPVLLFLDLYEWSRPDHWFAAGSISPFFYQLALWLSIILAACLALRDTFSSCVDAGARKSYTKISLTAPQVYRLLPEQQKKFFEAAQRVDNKLQLESLTNTVLTSCARAGLISIFRETPGGLQEMSFETASDLGLVHGCWLDETVWVKKSSIKPALKKYYKSMSLKLSHIGNGIMRMA